MGDLVGDGRWETGDGRWETGDGRWEMGDGRWWETVRWGGRQELSRIFRCGGRGEWWWVMTVKARCW